MKAISGSRKQEWYWEGVWGTVFLFSHGTRWNVDGERRNDIPHLISTTTQIANRWLQ